MYFILGLAVLWLLWKIYSDNRAAEREQARREVLEDARREVQAELRHLEQRYELEESQLEVEERQFELEEQRIQLEEERSGRRFVESRSNLENWKRTLEVRRDKLEEMNKLLREWRARHIDEVLRPALVESRKPPADDAHVRRSGSEDEDDEGGWPGYGA